MKLLKKSTPFSLLPDKQKELFCEAAVIALKPQIVGDDLTARFIYELFTVTDPYFNTYVDPKTGKESTGVQAPADSPLRDFFANRMVVNIQKTENK